MTRQEWQIGVIGLLGGIVLTILVQTLFFTSTHGNMGMTDMVRMMGGNRQLGMNMGMNDMIDEISNETGDDFDKVFITTMIMHHQGAIEMAEEAKDSAKHDEIKTLADAIITAQTKEINEMKEWYKSWYGTDAPTYRMNSMMSH